MMNSLAGMAHAIFGCQPLLVLRPTGPITLLFEKLLDFANQHSLPFWPLGTILPKPFLFETAKKSETPFFFAAIGCRILATLVYQRPFFAWTGIFVGLLMFLISAFELCRHLVKITVSFTISTNDLSLFPRFCRLLGPGLQFKLSSTCLTRGTDSKVCQAPLAVHGEHLCHFHWHGGSRQKLGPLM